MAAEDAAAEEDAEAAEDAADAEERDANPATHPAGPVSQAQTPLDTAAGRTDAMPLAAVTTAPTRHPATNVRPPNGTQWAETKSSARTDPEGGQTSSKQPNTQPQTRLSPPRMRLHFLRKVHPTAHSSQQPVPERPRT